VLSLLLHHRMHCEDPALEGRLILASIFECTYEAMSRIDLLRPDCPLREAGLVVLDDAEENPENLLGARFTLSDQSLDCFRQEITGKPTDEARGPGHHDPYESNGEFLVDLRVIHNLYQLRSARVFATDRWGRLHNATFQPDRDLNQRIRRCWERVRDRLGSTPDSGKFPGVRLMREYNLREKEMVCVIHLLFKELYEGNAYADVADLLRLISRTEGELIQNRRFLMDYSCLIKRELISVEPFLDGRTLTGEAYLNDWVVNYLFGSSAAEENIQDDERIDWHMYLAELDDTQGFFHDLGAN
ncbi:MAG: hypothetical protein VX951_12835, partial [Planctomycetota bacterium]|nr:hypothetical protein [Planctomycetota bacterium]